MTPAEMDKDKQRWWKARQLLDTQTGPQIQKWLFEQADEEYREDMRRRLNEMHKNRKSGRWQTKARE